MPLKFLVNTLLKLKKIPLFPWIFHKNSVKMSSKNNLRQNSVGLEQQIYAKHKKFYTTAGCDGWDI